MPALTDSRKDCRGYQYHYGRGVTGTNQISAQKYGLFCEQFKACFDAAQIYSYSHSELDLQDCVDGYRWKATELLANDLNVRVADDEKKTAVQSMIAVFGQIITACEVWRFIRDN